MDDGEAGHYTISPWDVSGVAHLEATGSDGRAALEAALRAVLALAINGPNSDPDQESASEEALAAPIRGEGGDLAALFVDLTDDLLAQLDEFDGGLRDVSLDGLLRRDDGGFTAWGYAMTTRGGAERRAIRLRQPHVAVASAGVVIRAVLEREAAP